MMKLIKMFKELTIQDKINVLYKDNTIETNDIINISSHNGYICFKLKQANINIKCKPEQAIHHCTEHNLLFYTNSQDMVFKERG